MPSEVNLTAFETYFSERRPFFVEGKNIYQFEPSNTIVINNFSADNLFYSRRIGRSPHNTPNLSANEYADIPESSTILGAMKLSGKTKNGLSIGVLESVTSNENAVIDSAGTRRKESVEPLTNYFVGRVQKDFGKGTTVIGGMITAVNRDITNPALDYLHTAAYTAGIDFNHNWHERAWYVGGNAEFSYVKGKEQAMIATQQSSARYYQRPDAHYLSVDSSLTSLSGYGGTLKFGKFSKKKLQFETSFTVRSPGLEFNDIGYMLYSDFIHHGTWVAYYLREPFSIFNNFYLNTNYWMYWNYSGKLLSTFTNLNFNSQFKNRWRINGSFTRMGENISTSLLRGGPSFTLPGGEELNLNISTDQSKKTSFNIGGYLGLGDVKSYTNQQYWMGLNVRPMNALSITFSPTLSIMNSSLQYVEATQVNSNPRYIFAELDQKTASITFRINYTINPELSLEYYGQPFVSAGKYTNFNRTTSTNASKFKDRYHIFTANEIKYTANENTYAITEDGNSIPEYSITNPNFNFRQFRSNLVIRWEYSPGSTVFLVWSQGRTSSDTNGSFEYGQDMKDLFAIQPHNVFLIKFSYWFSI